MSLSKKNLEQMLRDLIEEVGTWHPYLRVFGGQILTSLIRTYDLSITPSQDVTDFPLERISRS